jgi:hypothetical protein
MPLAVTVSDTKVPVQMCSECSCRLWGDGVQVCYTCGNLRLWLADGFKTRTCSRKEHVLQLSVLAGRQWRTQVFFSEGGGFKKFS